MSTVEIQLPSGQTAEVEMPEGSNPDTFIPHAAQMISQQGEPAGVGEAIGQGLKDIFPSIVHGIGNIGSAAMTAPDPEQGFLDRLLNVGKGAAGGASMGIYQPEASTPAEQAQQTLGNTLGMLAPWNLLSKGLGLAGLGARAAAPVAGAIMGGARDITQGQPLSALQHAITGAGAQGVMQEVPQAVKSYAGSKFGLGLGAQPVQEAIQEQAGNIRANQQAVNDYAQNLMQWNRQQYEAHQLGQQVSSPGPTPLERISPLAQTVKPKLTPREAYSFLDAVKDPPVPYTYPSLTSTIDAVGADLAGSFKAFNSPKMSGLLDELKARNMQDPIAEIPNGVAGFRENGELGAYYLKQVMEKYGAALGKEPAAGLSIKDFSNAMSGIGQLTDSTSPLVSRSASRLYSAMKDDLAHLGPTGDLLLKAQAVARQTNAAGELANHIFKFGSAYDQLGNLKIAESLDKLFAKDKYLRESFPLKDREAIQNTLNDIFTLNKSNNGQPPELQKILPEDVQPSRSEGILARHPFIVGGAASSILNIKHGLGVGLAVLLPRMLLKAMNTESGRNFVSMLYRDATPSMKDIARIGALVSFVKSTGERDPEMEKFLQAQARAKMQMQERAKQSAQAQMLPLLLQAQQGGKSK